MFKSRNNRKKNPIENRNIIADTKIILIGFFLCVGICIFAGWFPKAIAIYPDELIYLEYAKSLSGGEGLLIHHTQSEYPVQKILYSLCILLAMFVKSVVWRIRIISIINSILVASVVFPTYLLAKDIVNDRKQRLTVSLLALTFPIILNALGFMSESSYLPIVVWGVYVTWLFMKAQDIKQKRKISLILGILYYLAYLNKEVALYLLLAYICVIFYRAVVEKRYFKEDVSCLMIVGLSFLFTHFIFYISFFRDLENGYVKALMGPSFSKAWLVFFLFAFTINFVFLIFSTGVFPIVILPFSKKEKGAEHYFSVFLLLSLMIACGVITYTVTIREEFGESVLRQHLRYVEPLMVPLVVQFIALLNNQEILKTNKYKNCIIAILIFWAGILVFCVRGIGIGSTVDNTMLACYTFLVRQVEKFSSNCIIILNIGVVVLVTLLCFCLLKKTKYFIAVFLCAMYIINIGNCGIEYMERCRDYRIPIDRIEEMQQLQNAINKLNGNFLYMSSELSQVDNRLIDSYINCENLYYTYIELAEEMGYLDDGVIDIQTEKIRCTWPQVNYEDLNDIEYILVNKECDNRLDKSNLISIDEFCGKNYVLYKNLTPNKISVFQLFPKVVGNCSYVTKDDNIFYTRNTTGKYISNAAGDCVIYGPYCTIDEGNYKVELCYSNNNSDRHEMVGKLEIGDAEHENLVEIELFADQDTITLEKLEVEQKYNQMEVRLWAYEPDIQFEWVQIEKLQ